MINGNGEYYMHNSDNSLGSVSDWCDVLCYTSQQISQRLKRNDAVWFYRTGLIQRCSPNIELAEEIIGKHSYEDMLNSCKPLEDKYWFTQEEIERIDSNHIAHITEKYMEKKMPYDFFPKINEALQKHYNTKIKFYNETEYGIC